jgi:hypothetical protein
MRGTRLRRRPRGTGDRRRLPRQPGRQPRTDHDPPPALRPGQRCDCLANTGHFVDPQVVHDDDITGLQRWQQDLLDIGQEQLAVDCAVEAVGAKLLFIPPYSPDLNPIEMAFSKLKALLRAKAIRTAEALWKALGDLCDSFSPGECANYFRHDGYFQSS